MSSALRRSQIQGKTALLPRKAAKKSVKAKQYTKEPINQRTSTFQY